MLVKKKVEKQKQSKLRDAPDRIVLYFRLYPGLSQLPGFRVDINLSDKIKTQERQAYDAFTLLGDLGGFNAAIILFPSYLMAFYSARMYNNSVYEQMLVKKKYRQR